MVCYGISGVVNTKPFNFNVIFSAKDAIYYVAIATVIFSRVKISYFHWWWLYDLVINFARHLLLMAALHEKLFLMAWTITVLNIIRKSDL